MMLLLMPLTGKRRRALLALIFARSMAAHRSGTANQTPRVELPTPL
jgi:hypothetical protein